MRAWRFSLAMLALAALQSSYAANQWEICDLQVLVEKLDRAEQRIVGTVRVVKAAGEAQCPAPQERITFLPATPDYQSVLPSKRWPNAGTVVHIRYRYLIGACKQRDICKIEHYSVLK